jgi:hypothetical protein
MKEAGVPDQSAAWLAPSIVAEPTWRVPEEASTTDAEAPAG